MNRSTVIDIFKLWKSAGLKPPIDNSSAEQANNLIDGFMKAYHYLNDDDLLKLGNRLAHNKFWPTFHDVDELLQEMRRQQEPKGPKVDIMKERKARGTISLKDKNDYLIFVRQTAERCFPEADPDFLEGIIEGCPTQIFAQGLADRTCACCINGLVHGEACKNDYHRSFLRVVPDAVEPLVYCVLNVEHCEKYQGHNADR